MGAVTRISRWADAAAAIENMVSQRVLVGVPAQEALRKPKPGEPSNINNAFLAYVHTNGAPEANIPPRPFLGPAIRDMRAEITSRMLDIARKGLRGDKKAVENGYHALGIKASTAAKRKINEGIPPPLADSTLRARARRGRRGAAVELRNRGQGIPASTELAKPLIDTGQLRNSITYVIRRIKSFSFR